MAVDIESIRFGGESNYAAVLRQLPGVDALAAKVALARASGITDTRQLG